MVTGSRGPGGSPDTETLDDLNLEGRADGEIGDGPAMVPGFENPRFENLNHHIMMMIIIIIIIVIVMLLLVLCIITIISIIIIIIMIIISSSNNNDNDSKIESRDLTAAVVADSAGAARRHTKGSLHSYTGLCD